MSICEVTGRVPFFEDTAENKTKIPAHLEHFSEKEIVSKTNGTRGRNDDSGRC